MKRLFAILFAVFYFTAASGITVYTHYCMGQLVNRGINHQQGDLCGNCGMKNADSKNCCKEEHKQFKIEKAQHAALQVFQFKVFCSPVFADLPSALPVPKPNSIQEEFPLNHAPPKTGKAPAFIRNCSFRI